ncbi:MAG: 3-phosphoshikimate 1-carboxyvinyltransferase [Acidobacteriota bacterium]
MDPTGEGNAAARVAPHAPHGLAGSIRVPPSKSLTQRALVAAAVAGGGSRVVRPLDAEDPRLLYEGLRAAGFRLEWGAEGVRATGRDGIAGASLFLGNNGTGARFMLAQAAGLPGEWVVDGVPRLRERPMGGLRRALEDLGARIEPATSIGRAPGSSARQLPLRVFGATLPGGEVRLDPSASSQFVSALLLLGARLENGIVVGLESEPPSRPYLDLTAEVLRAFGARFAAGEGGRILGVRGPLRPAEFEVEGDWSAAAFPMAAAAVAGGTVEVAGVRAESRQGDARVTAVLAAAGCDVTATGDGVRVAGPASRPIEAGLRDAPDLFPALAVVVAFAGGRLSGLEGLAGKESDRTAVMAAHLRALGFEVEFDGGVFGGAGRRAAATAPLVTLDPTGDHRIAMALAVAGAAVPGVRISDPSCVAKSWPEFWSAWDAVVGSP